MDDRVRRRRKGTVTAEAEVEAIPVPVLVASVEAFVIDDGLGEFFWRCRCSS